MCRQIFSLSYVVGLGGRKDVLNVFVHAVKTRFAGKPLGRFHSAERIAVAIPRLVRECYPVGRGIETDGVPEIYHAPADGRKMYLRIGSLSVQLVFHDRFFSGYRIEQYLL